MKFAICNETFVDWPHERAFAFAAECGYTGLEIAPFTLADVPIAGAFDVRDVPAAKRAEIVRLAAASGLEIIGLHWLLAKTSGIHLTSPEAAVRRKTAEYLSELARLCGDLGGKLMVLGSPQQRNLLPGVTHETAMDYAADVIQQSLPAFEEYGVVLGMEPLGPDNGNFLLTAAKGAELVAQVGSPHCRLHLDCKAMSSESIPIPDLVRQYRQLLVHFHVNDPSGKGPGFGSLEFEPILSALGEIDYRGWVSVEVFDYSPGVESLAADSIAYLRQCLERMSQT